MTAGKTVTYIAAAILILLGLATIFFGVMFIWATFSPQGQSGWAVTGIVTVAIGLAMIGGAVGLIWLANRRAAAAGAVSQNVTLKIDLPGDVNLDTLKCKSCGGALTMDNIDMVAGAPVVSCPYCNTTYQLTEEPKW